MPEPGGWETITKKEILAQLGIEPRSPTLCLKSAGLYVAGVIPLDHCAFFDDGRAARIQVGKNVSEYR